MSSFDTHSFLFLLHHLILLRILYNHYTVPSLADCDGKKLEASKTSYEEHCIFTLSKPSPWYNLHSRSPSPLLCFYAAALMNHLSPDKGLLSVLNHLRENKKKERTNERIWLVFPTLDPRRNGTKHWPFVCDMMGVEWYHGENLWLTCFFLIFYLARVRSCTVNTFILNFWVTHCFASWNKEFCTDVLLGRISGQPLGTLL